MSLTELVNNSLDEVLTRGYFKKEIKLSKKLKVTITTLSGDDLTQARMSIPDSAKKELMTYSNSEKFEILSRVVTEINGKNILEEAKEEMKSKEGKEDFIDPEKFALISTRKFLGQLPPKLLNYMSEEYNKLAKEQADYINKEIGEDIENF